MILDEQILAKYFAQMFRDVVLPVLEDMQSKMVTKEDIKNMVVKDDIKDMVVKDDIKDMVVKDDIKDMIVKDDIKDMIVKDDIKDMVTKIDIDRLELRLERIESRIALFSDRFDEHAVRIKKLENTRLAL